MQNGLDLGYELDLYGTKIDSNVRNVWTGMHMGLNEWKMESNSFGHRMNANGLNGFVWIV